MCAEGFRDDGPHLHCQCVDSCCTQHGSTFEWRLETLCVLSCMQTHPVKCSLDLRKDKNVSVVSHVDDPLICAKPATLEKFWTQITKLVVIKRGEALNPRISVTYLGFECRSVHDGDRRGFTVKPTAKYVDECLDIVQLQNAKAVTTPLTEQKSLNLHDETTVCGQVQHSLFRAVVGKLQHITGVRPDLMFATKCLSFQLASPTLADLTRAKKVLKYLKGTRELNLYLTILH